MRITNINNINYRQNSFTSNSIIHIRNQQIQNCNITRFFRKDLDWDEFVTFIDAKYKPVNNVNIFDFGCSDGSEVWTLIVSILEKIKENSQKFFPIKCFDIDKNIITMANSRKCNISDSDFREINLHTQDGYYKYFITTYGNSNEYPLALIPKGHIQDLASFECCDIIKKLNKLPKKNNVILCRNFWKYMPTEKREELAKLLADKLDKTSLVVIGSLEKGFKIDKLLEKNGFRETSIENVFQKII